MFRNEAAVFVDGLCKRYGERMVVDHLRFSVEQGEFFSLLGVNGAGKTTLIRMLSGITRPDAGDAYLMGSSIQSALPEVKKKIGISPQESAVAEKLSVRENLRFIPIENWHQALYMCILYDKWLEPPVWSFVEQLVRKIRANNPDL